ncbi:MAG: TIR domain-containing protein [Anaerolineales bacterium]|nr:TIR domain-containing protein [Anaerolineales bacterium]
MSENYKNAVARIVRNRDQTPIGAGILIGTRQVLTCAHVVNSALGRRVTEFDPPPEDCRIMLDFPLPAPGTWHTARVVKWEGPRADGGGDMALLELETAPGTAPVSFSIPGEVWGHPFRAFGFPDHHPQGRDASGVLRGRNAIQRLMMEQTNPAQNFALPGFSGTMVWDETLGAVIGMIVLGEYGVQMSAFLIPADQLQAFWPALPVTRAAVAVPRPAEFKYHVFISYTAADSDWVETTLLPRVEAAGLTAFVEFRDIEPGASRVDEIQRAVIESAKTLVVLTPEYLRDEWSTFGNVMAKSLDPAARMRRLLPLMKRPCEPPLYIAHLVPVDFTSPAREAVAWKQLLRALGATTG